MNSNTRETFYKVCIEKAESYRNGIDLQEELWKRLNNSFDELLADPNITGHIGLFKDIRRFEGIEHKSGLNVELKEAASTCAEHYIRLKEAITKDDAQMVFGSLLQLAEAYGRFSYFKYFLHLEATTRTKRKKQGQNAAKPFTEKMQKKVCELLNQTPLEFFNTLAKPSSFPIKAIESIEEALAAYADTIREDGGKEVREKGPDMVKNWIKGNRGFKEKVEAIVATKISSPDHDQH